MLGAVAATPIENVLVALLVVVVVVAVEKEELYDEQMSHRAVPKKQYHLLVARDGMIASAYSVRVAVVAAAAAEQRIQLA